MKKWLFALGAVALLAEPVSALPVRVSHEEAVVGVQPIQVGDPRRSRAPLDPPRRAPPGAPLTSCPDP